MRMLVRGDAYARMRRCVCSCAVMRMLVCGHVHAPESIRVCSQEHIPQRIHFFANVSQQNMIPVLLGAYSPESKANALGSIYLHIMRPQQGHVRILSGAYDPMRPCVYSYAVTRMLVCGDAYDRIR